MVRLVWMLLLLSALSLVAVASDDPGPNECLPAKAFCVEDVHCCSKKCVKDKKESYKICN